jgi:hypothetical protein
MPFRDNEQDDLSEVGESWTGGRQQQRQQHGRPLWSTATCRPEGAQVADAYERC